MNIKKRDEVDRIKRNYESIDNYFLGATIDFLLEKGELYYSDINKINEKLVEAFIYYKDNSSVRYLWEFGKLYEKPFGGYSLERDRLYSSNQKNITVCIKLALIPSEKRLSDYLYSEAKSKGYVSGQLYYRCALNNYSLGTCLEFGNKNSLLIKYHDREKCYLGDENAFKMSIS